MGTSEGRIFHQISLKPAPSPTIGEFLSAVDTVSPSFLCPQPSPVLGGGTWCDLKNPGTRRPISLPLSLSARNSGMPFFWAEETGGLRERYNLGVDNLFKLGLITHWFGNLGKFN